MDAKAYFKGKKITLMGLGLLGRGVGDAKFLAECGAELIVTDLKAADELESSLEQLRPYPNIILRLGQHALEDFQGRDLIIKAAGVPLNSPYIEEAKKHKIPVRMSSDLFAELAGIPTIGITGTRGKSTVTHLLAHILNLSARQAGSGGVKVLVGGNVRGVSSLALLPEVTQDSVAVLELDSWQLQGFGEAGLSPNIAVFTTFLPDHMNYYRKAAVSDDEAMQLYFADKANIFLNQDESDVCILGEQVAPFVKEYGYQQKIRAQVTIAGEKNLPKGVTLKILGEHNRYNAGLAALAALAFGVDKEDIKKGLESFPGLPGRLEFLREVNGVKIYNDNNSTTPDATIAAIQALRSDQQVHDKQAQGAPHNQNVILIMGGADKGLDMSALVQEIPKHCKKVILLVGTGTDRIIDQLPEATPCGRLSEAVSAAFKSATPGDVVVFSPAFASFGLFVNEYDRNDQFVELVQHL